jgi:hypothetical protein
MNPVNNILGRNRSKFKVGDKFTIGDEKREYIVTIPRDKIDKTYGFEAIDNKAIHGDVDEDLMIKKNKQR